MEISEMGSFCLERGEIGAELVGQPVLLRCLRYLYRGIVREVGEDYVRLCQPRAVLSIRGNVLGVEDMIPCDLLVLRASCLGVYRPEWAGDGLDPVPEADAPSHARLVDVLRKYQDQPICVLTSTFWYRGMLSGIDDKRLSLSHAMVVTETGPASSAKPLKEQMAPGGKISIQQEDMEIVCQLPWAGYELSDPEHAGIHYPARRPGSPA